MRRYMKQDTPIEEVTSIDYDTVDDEYTCEAGLVMMWKIFGKKFTEVRKSDIIVGLYLENWNKPYTEFKEAYNKEID